MPFAVFRRHQRKLLAVIAILAIFLFVVGDTLPKLINGSPVQGGNAVVVALKDRTIHRSDILLMQNERNNANLFMAELNAILYRRASQNFFGDLSTRSLVDALILEEKADQLGMPHGPEDAREWLKQRVGGIMTRDLFEMILRQFNNRVSGEQILAQIANQIRIANVRLLLGSPVVTPLDVYENYRNQNERVAVRAVGFRVEDFLSKVGEPSAIELQKFYDTYKDTLPDPNRATPGFKIPRQVRAEILSLDGESLVRGYRDQLTEAELRSYYENRKSEFPQPSAFPPDIFQGAPELTPPQVQPFADIRSNLATSLADEKAQAEILSKFGRIKDDVLIPFADKYLQAVEENAEANKNAGGHTSVGTALPRHESLQALAEKEKLSYELTPRLTREAAEQYGLIHDAEQGLTRFSGGHKFAEELFDSKASLFEPIELTDGGGRRYLVRKIEDNPPRVPALDEIRPEVIVAWKTKKARPLAKKAADEYAAKVKAAGGKISGDIVEGRPVITTDPLTRFQPGRFLPGQFFETGPPTPTELTQLPAAGKALRDAYFGLTEGNVAVAPNQPETVYYVLAEPKRIAASFDALYAPNGDYFRYRSETRNDAYKTRDEQWMNQLREQRPV